MWPQGTLGEHKASRRREWSVSGCSTGTAREVGVEASDNSLNCLVKEPRLDPSVMDGTKDFFHYEQPRPIFELTVHSNPVPLRLSWNSQSAPHGLSGAQPLVQGTMKGRGPSCDRFLPAALQAGRGQFLASPQVILL